jgi:rRNA maturation endonuclease Nob1
MEKFDGGNFHLWKFKMRMMLSKHGLWKFVDGSATIPNDENQITDYNKKATRAFVVVAEARREKNLYLLNVNVRKENVNVAKSSNERVTLWHQKLGHLNMASLTKLEKMVDGMNLKKVPLHHVCETCIEGKQQRTFFS